MAVSVSLLVITILLLLSITNALDESQHRTRAGHYRPSSALSGSCGYGTTALRLNGGYVATGSESVASGACYLVRCKYKSVCSNAGVKVVVTGRHRGDREGLRLSGAAFAAMARGGMGEVLEKLGSVEVEYKRVACELKERMVGVEGSSRRPGELAVRFVHHGRVADMVAVDVARVGSTEWRSMEGREGGVWSTRVAPEGPLLIRMVLRGGEGKVWAEGEKLPADWAAGAVYHSGIKIYRAGDEDCAACHADSWK